MAQVGAADIEVVAGGPEEGVQIVGRSPTELFWRRIRQDRYAIAGAVFIVLITVLAIGASLVVKVLVHHGPNQNFIYSGTQPNGLPKAPDGRFWFGHDSVGRDIFVRVLYGARISLIVALVATGLSVIIGVVLGLVAGFYRGWIDMLVSRTIDVMMSLPILLLALGLAAVCSATAQGCFGGHLHVSGLAGGIVLGVSAVLIIMAGVLFTREHHGYAGVLFVLGIFGALLWLTRVPMPSLQPGLPLVILIIAFANWTYIARIVRGQVLSLREKEFVESSYSTGASDWRIMMREIMPNLAMPIIVYSSLIIPNNILFEAALSFLGAGLPPETPSWGNMIAQSTSIYTVAWWYMFFPGLFLFLLTFAFNLLGDGLRDALDPKTAK
jgi:peptide/nickel transport system permease protein